MITLFTALYDFLERRKWLVGGVFLIMIVFAGGIVGTSLKPEENIAAMLPDDASTVARDFQLLQKAPFARKIMITIHADDPEKADDLPTVALALENALKEDGTFTAVSGGVDSAVGMNIMKTFNTINPAFFTDADFGTLETLIASEPVKQKVQANLRQLMSPDGMMNKQQIMDDPLGLSAYSVEKLQYVQMVSNLKLKNGRFISADGQHALLIAETDVEMTDSKGGRALLDSFNEVSERTLPTGFSGKILSSHCYTVANAEMIQRDLSVILSLTSIGILVIFVVYMRCWRAVVIFVFPAVVILIALATLTVAYDTVSGVTLGFGAVLMGISIDFALHIYFATLEKGDRKKGLHEVVSPGLVCALTTIAAFAVLQFSSLPGQRQLSVFAITGIIAAVALAFVALPHILPTNKGLPMGRGAQLLDAGNRLNKRNVLIAWGIVTVLCVPGMMRLSFDGNLRRLGAVPDELKLIEKQMAQTWGDFRGRAMIFAEGESQEAALQVNDKVFQLYRDKLKPNQLLTLAAVLPSQSTQSKRLDRWNAFREAHLQTIVTNLKSAGWPVKAAANAEAVLAKEMPLVTEQTLRDSGLGDLLNSLLVETGGKTLVITMVPDEPGNAAIFEAAGITSAYFVSQGRTGDAIGQAIASDFRRFITYALIIVVALVVILYRKPRLVFAALAPVLSGVVGLFAFMGYTGIPMNMFNVIASILLIGLGVDYGIFMVYKTRMGAGKATVLAVWVSALTTMAGFGALVLGRHPALFSIGVTVSVGIVFSIMTALFVVPALISEKDSEEGEER